MPRHPPISSLFPYHDALPISPTPMPSIFSTPPPEKPPFTSQASTGPQVLEVKGGLDRKSTRLNSSHVEISYAVFCLKKKKTNNFKDRVALREIVSLVVDTLMV